MIPPIEFAPMGCRRAAIGRGMGSRSVRRAGIAALVGAWSASFPTVASAEGAEAVHLAYEAPSRCPSESDFLDMVARDGGGLARASDLQSARSFLLRVSGTASVTGTLVVRERDGTEALREVVDVECEVVVRALAVLVALSLESPLSTPADSPTAEAPSASPPGPPELAPEREIEGPLPLVPGMAASLPAIERPASAIEEEPVGLRPPQGWRTDVSLEGTLSTGAMPSLDPGLAAYVELLDETPSFFAPSIRLGAESGASQGGQFSNSTIYRRFVGRLDACPFRGMLARPWSDDAFTLQTCLRIDVGRIEVDESESWAKADAARLWVAPAGLLRLRWTSPSLFVELEGGIAFPLVREHFFAGGAYADNLDFEVPPRAMTTGLGFGVFIW